MVRRPILTVLLNAAIVIAVLEVCARVDDWAKYRAPLLGPYTVDRLYETVDGVQQGKPYARYQSWQLNSLGLRGPELSHGTHRVLCIGASETLGMLETPGKEYPRQLEEALRKLSPRRPVDVANLSYFGLTLATANRLLPHVMREAHPEVVVVYPSYGGYVARQSLLTQAGPPAERPPLLRLSEKLSDLIKSQLPPGLMTRLRHRQIDKYMKGRAPIERMPADRAEFLRYDLANLVATIRRGGAKPVLVTHATRFGGDHDAADREYFLVSWRKFYPLYSEQALLDMESQLNATVRAFAAENSVPLVDAAAALPGGARYFTDHEHFTDAGATALADLIAPAAAELIGAATPTLVRSETGARSAPRPANVD